MSFPGSGLTTALEPGGLLAIMPEPVPRSQRLARIRRGVAAGTVALFVASLAAVFGWGRQPAASHARAVTPDAPATADPSSGADPYGGADPDSGAAPYGGAAPSSGPAPSGGPAPPSAPAPSDGGPAQAAPSQSAPADPGPLTSRSS